MNDESEFDKLLKESLTNVENVLNEKTGKSFMDDEIKSYQPTMVSYEDLYEDIEDIDFSHRKDGIQNKISNNLQSKIFKFKSDEILDLHGLSPKDAETAVNDFLNYHYQKRTRYLLVIHGKGTKTQTKKAPIKRLVEKIMIASPHILAANSADRKNGGRGATILLLKR